MDIGANLGAQFHFTLPHPSNKNQFISSLFLLSLSLYAYFSVVSVFRRICVVE